MLIRRRLNLLQKSIRLAAVASSLWFGHCAAYSQEPVPVSKEEKKEKPTTELNKKNILGYRVYRPSESVLGSRDIDVPAPTLPLPANPAPRISRQEQERLDREKNWIFVLPGDEKNINSAEELLGIDTLKSKDEKPKSVLTRFLENKPTSTLMSEETTSYGFNRNESKNPAAPQIFGSGNQRPNGFGAWSQPGTRPENLSSNSGTPMSLAERWQGLYGPRAEKMRDEKRVRMNEFESLFGSQTAVSSSEGFGTLQNNSKFQPLTPVPGDSGVFNRNTPATGGFRNPVRPLSGVSSSGQPGINTHSSGPSASLAPKPEPPRKVAQPVVLPIPKRNF